MTEIDRYSDIFPDSLFTDINLSFTDLIFTDMILNIHAKASMNVQIKTVIIMSDNVTNVRFLSLRFRIFIKVVLRVLTKIHVLVDAVLFFFTRDIRP